MSVCSDDDLKPEFSESLFRDGMSYTMWQFLRDLLTQSLEIAQAGDAVAVAEHLESKLYPMVWCGDGERYAAYECNSAPDERPSNVTNIRAARTMTLMLTCRFSAKNG